MVDVKDKYNKIGLFRNESPVVFYVTTPLPADEPIESSIKT